MGGLGGHIEVVVVGGVQISRDSQPSDPTLGESSMRSRGLTASKRVPGAVWPEQLIGPRTLASTLDLRQSGMALENHIPTHLKQKEERKTTKPRN